MNVTLLSSPSEQPISDERVAEWCRIDTGQDAATIQMLVFSALALVESYLNKTLMQTTFRGQTECRASSYDLPRVPVYDVMSVKVDGVALVRGTDWKVCGDRVVLTALPDACPVIEWIAGFHDVPPNVSNAIALLVSALYDNRTTIDPMTVKAVEWLCAPHRRVTL
ncbi:hypothetical protein [uncultured Sphingomonas sp.]|uniref:hypothetical protein n=1 Tax=uncultured Sphingomonas sp. TaxID=158754 RepID=UPI0025ECDCE2|nr:hypothetical protein [uncultured Sphingomonas sp.]